MKRRTVPIGTILQIDLSGGYHSYCRVLAKSNIAFYDLHSKDVEPTPTIVASPVLFIVAVREKVMATGKWKEVGLVPLEKELESLPKKFIQDPLRPNSFEIYDTLTGKTIPATKDDCVGLEKAAAWEGSHIEERLQDHFAGRPNRWAEQMKLPACNLRLTLNDAVTNTLHG